MAEESIKVLTHISPPTTKSIFLPLLIHLKELLLLYTVNANIIETARTLLHDATFHHKFCFLHVIILFTSLTVLSRPQLGT